MDLKAFVLAVLSSLAAVTGTSVLPGVADDCCTPRADTESLASSLATELWEAVVVGREGCKSDVTQGGDRYLRLPHQAILPIKLTEHKPDPYLHKTLTIPVETYPAVLSRSHCFNSKPATDVPSHSSTLNSRTYISILKNSKDAFIISKFMD